METTIDDLKQLEQMLNSSSEDFEIALSNIKNLDLDLAYIKLLSKSITTITNRNKFIGSFDSINNLINYTFIDIKKDIDKDVKLKNSETLKDYYLYCINKFINNIVDILDVPINDLNIMLKYKKDDSKNN